MKIANTARLDGSVKSQTMGRLPIFMMSALSLALAASYAFADGHETIITAQGYSSYNEFVYPEGSTHVNYVNLDAPQGGEIATWAQGTFDSFNPYSRKGRGGALASAAVESIMVSTADDAVSVYCYLCETIEYPETEDWVIVNLRKDITFSDGSPATAEDIVFTHYLFLEQGLASYAQSVSEKIPLVEALDDYTVKFTFGEDVEKNNLIYQVGATPLLSKKWFEDNELRLDESWLLPILGSGPYVVDSYDVNQQIIYKKNPDFWGADHWLTQGHYNFDTIRVEYFADSNAAFEAFKAGEYTFRRENSSLQWATQYDFPGVENGEIILETLEDGSLPGATGFVFNLRREKWQDPNVREALGLMYNFTWTNETLQYGLFQQRESFWQNSDLAATGVAEGLELDMLNTVADLIDPAILTEPVTMPHESGDRLFDRRNARRASGLLDDAGWIVGDDGLRRKNGKTLAIELLSASPTFDRILNPYIENLKSLGVDAVYNRVDPAQFTNRRREFDYDMFYGGYTNGLVEGQGLGQRYGSDRAEISVFNPAGYGSEAVDKLIEIAIASETQSEMQAAVRAIDRVMRAERFIIPAWYLGKHWVATYDMFGHPDELPPYALGHLDFWWAEVEKQTALKEAGAIR